MSENEAVCENGETSSGPESALSPVWVKIEKVEPIDNEDTEKETIFEPEITVKEDTPSPSSPSDSEPLNGMVHVINKTESPQQSDKSSDESSDSDYEGSDPEAVFEPKVKLIVKSNEDISGNNDTDVKQESTSPNGVESVPKTCDECGWIFPTDAALAAHKMSHDGRKKEFHCNKCNRSFPFHVHLYRHQRSGDCPGNGNKFTCSICQKQLKSKELLRSHQTVHTTERKHKCDLCGKMFKHQRYLASHKASHADRRPYRCDLCGKLFKHSSSAALHKRRHTEAPIKMFPCSVCDKPFHVINALEAHMRTHTNERPFSCAVCLRTFSHKHNMLRHMQCHDKIVQTKCEICQKEFPRESRLKYHMRVHYEDKKPYSCNLCKKTYSHSQNIIRHYKSKHPDHEYIAPITDAEFANKAWEMHKIQGIADKEQGIYILPELPTPSTEDEYLDPLPQPEMVILDTNNIKIEIKDEM